MFLPFFLGKVDSRKREEGRGVQTIDMEHHKRYHYNWAIIRNSYLFLDTQIVREGRGPGVRTTFFEIKLKQIGKIPNLLLYSLKQNVVSQQYPLPNYTPYFLLCSHSSSLSISLSGLNCILLSPFSKVPHVASTHHFSPHICTGT